MYIGARKLTSMKELDHYSSKAGPTDKLGKREIYNNYEQFSSTSSWGTVNNDYQANQWQYKFRHITWVIDFVLNYKCYTVSWW
jgi:hypothetical protein